MVKKYILLVLAVIIYTVINSTAYAQIYIPAKVLYWKDGDTVQVQLSKCVTTAPRRKQCGEIAIRINEINTAEYNSKARCVNEKILAQQAKDISETLAPIGSTVFLSEIKEDKYSGRLLATISKSKGFSKVNIGIFLLEKEVAVPYHGERRDPYFWCNPKIISPLVHR